MNTIRVSGNVDADNVPAQLRESQYWFESGSPLLINLADVDHADSAGVALLLEWLRRAKAAHVDITFQGAPRQMRAIIAFCELDDIIVMDDAHDEADP